MITRDHDFRALPSERGGKVQGVLAADGFDDSVESDIPRMGSCLFGCLRKILHADGRAGAQALRNPPRVGPTGDGDHARSRANAQIGKHGAEEADSYNRHGLALADIAAAEDIHCASERLARDDLVVQRFRQTYGVIARSNVVFRIRA